MDPGTGPCDPDHTLLGLLPDRVSGWLEGLLRADAGVEPDLLAFRRHVVLDGPLSEVASDERISREAARDRFREAVTPLLEVLKPARPAGDGGAGARASHARPRS